MEPTGPLEQRANGEAEGLISGSETDPMRPRRRPGVTVEAQAATWDSTVFAISVGAAIRYLEVPADRVPAFLQSVDRGELDSELTALATTPTGAVLDLPGRIRRLAAFDRIIRGAVAQAERDPVTGQLTEAGWRPRKRRRDDPDRTGRSSHEHQHAESASSVGAAAGTAAPVAVGAVARAGWWSAGTTAVAAVSAVVVVAVAVIFVVARSGSEPADVAAVARDAATTAAESTAAAATAAATAQTVSAPVAAPTTITTPIGTTPVGTTPVGTTPIGTTPVGTTPVGGNAVGSTPGAGTAASAVAPSAASATADAAAAGSRNPFTGTYNFTRTVAEANGNDNYSQGATDSGTLRLTAACDSLTCAVTGGGDWGTATVSGDSLEFTGTAPDRCPNNPGISTTDAWTVSLSTSGSKVVDGATRVQKMTGTGTITVADANGCDAEVRPVTYSYSFTRVG